MTLTDRMRRTIRAHGPITVAAFMESALYDAQDGYYATSAQRSGRAGDFYTSVDVGPLFGELMAEFAARRWAAWRDGAPPDEPFWLIEAGAGNGRLMRDLLDTLAAEQPACYAAARVGLVERSARARAAHAATLGPHAPRLAWSDAELPPAASGLLLSNELLDAFPAHRVRMTPDGLREVHVTERDGRLTLIDGPPSSPDLAAYLAAANVALADGAVADLSLSAIAWVREAARRLSHGTILFVDYGYEARELFSSHRREGTLVSYERHQFDPADSGSDPDHPPWLSRPGRRDLTTHVDFTSVSRAAEAEGWRRECLLEQSRFLIDLGLGARLASSRGSSPADIRRRLAAKALALPLGPGGAHRALVLTRRGPGRQV